MKIGTVLVASDLNPLYSEFIPIFVKSWSILIPEADICIVLIADEIPEKFLPYAKHIRLFRPIPGMHTAFQAQCIRLLYPRFIERDEGVLITDMDMIPMNRSYYVDSIRQYPSDNFVVYRDVCLPGEISMCYNVAHPSVWRSMVGSEDSEVVLQSWYGGRNYDGIHGGKGWGTDQIILVNLFNAWNGQRVVLNDTITKFGRLDRTIPSAFSSRFMLRARIRSGDYADYHCLRPYSDYKEMNDFVVSCLEK